MKYAASILALFALLAPTALVAGPIADLFRDGVFGTLWGATPAEVETAFPAGKWKEFGKIRMYYVTDGRTVFGIERTPKQHIVFTFSTSERLNGVSVEFPGDVLSVTHFGNLLAKCTEVFGPPIRGADAPEPYSYSSDVGGVTSTQVLWPADEGIMVNIVSGVTQTFLAVKGNLSLNIGYTKLEAASKENLGLK